jgi:hypothetical protein
MEPLEPWFWHVMSGNSTNYSILLKEVDNLWEWGLHVEVEQYRKLDGQIQYTNDQLELMCCGVEDLQTQCMLCENHLIASHIQDKVGHLAGCFSYIPGLHCPSGIGQSRWEPKDKKGKGWAITEEPSKE